MDLLYIALPVVAWILYIAILGVFIKVAIYVFRLPKRLRELEKRIKQLEDKEN